MKLVLKKPYRELRQKSYPSIEDQLDALWHGMDKDAETRVEPFYSMLKEVKDSIPKDKI